MTVIDLLHNLTYIKNYKNRQRVDSLEKTLMLGGIGGKKRRGRQRMRWLDGITGSMDMNLSEKAFIRKRQKNSKAISCLNHVT